MGPECFHGFLFVRVSSEGVCVMGDGFGLPSLAAFVEGFDVLPEPEPVVYVSPVRWEVVSEYGPGKWVRVLGPTSRVRAEQWWVRYYRDGGPVMRVRQVGRVERSGPVVGSRGRPMTLERLRSMGSARVLRDGVWVRLPYRATALHVERWPELVAVLEAEQVLPYRPSVGVPVGWSGVECPEV